MIKCITFLFKLSIHGVCLTSPDSVQNPDFKSFSLVQLIHFALMTSIGVHIIHLNIVFKPTNEQFTRDLY